MRMIVYRKVLFMGVWDILFIGEELFFAREECL